MIEIFSIAKRKTQNTPKFYDGFHKALSIVLNLIDYKIERGLEFPRPRFFSYSFFAGITNSIPALLGGMPRYTK